VLITVTIGPPWQTYMLLEFVFVMHALSSYACAPTKRFVSKGTNLYKSYFVLQCDGFFRPKNEVGRDTDFLVAHCFATTNSLLLAIPILHPKNRFPIGNLTCVEDILFMTPIEDDRVTVEY
jgi:hypothetical protein